MKSLNLTIDNYFRHPLRWRRCPVRKLDPLKAFGVFIYWNKPDRYNLKKHWGVYIYFWKWFYFISTERP